MTVCWVQFEVERGCFLPASATPAGIEEKDSSSPVQELRLVSLCGRASFSMHDLSAPRAVHDNPVVINEARLFRWGLLGPSWAYPSPPSPRTQELIAPADWQRKETTSQASQGQNRRGPGLVKPLRVGAGMHRAAIHCRLVCSHGRQVLGVQEEEVVCLGWLVPCSPHRRNRSTRNPH